VKLQLKYTIYAIFAALFFSLSIPASKYLLQSLSPYFLASLLYGGAGLIMLILWLLFPDSKHPHLSFQSKDTWPIIGMIVLDVLAPIVMLIGLQTIHPAHVALMNNFEIVSTAVFAFFIFKEIIPSKLRIGIMIIILASAILSFENDDSFTFTTGSWWVLLAALLWGFENNLTRILSKKDPRLIVVIKGLSSGLISLWIAVYLDAVTLDITMMSLGLLVGIVSYGMSLWLYITAQRHLGAAKTSAFYAFAPFLGSLLSWIFFFEVPELSFYIGFMLMMIGAFLSL